MDDTTANMQEDGSAFEGWAVCLKCWLPEIIDTVHLSWVKPEIKDEHYNRFLYRVYKFNEMYEWFNYDKNYSNDIEQIINDIQDSKNNASIKNIRERSERRGETQIEYDIVNNNKDIFRQEFNLKIFDHQLPVGVKNIFTGKKSSIDLWGIGEDNNLYIFELKYNNNKVGVISELVFYLNVMNDIKNKNIGIPTEIKRENEITLYELIENNNLNNVKGLFLTNDLHPLLENKNILDILNKNSSELIFDFYRYSWNFINLSKYQWK